MKDGGIVHQCNLEEQRRSNRCFVELEVTGDDGNLRAALPEIGAEGVSEGGGRWRIVLPAGVEVEAIWGLVARQNLLVRKLSHRRDTLEEIFLRAMGHLAQTSGEAALDQAQLRADARIAREVLLSLGVEHISEFDRTLFKPVIYNA